MPKESSELVDTHLGEVKGVMKKIAGSSGSLTGNFWAAVGANSAPSALVVTLSAKDKTGGKALMLGKKLRKELKAIGKKDPLFARGQVIYENGKIVFEIVNGRLTPPKLKKAFKEEMANTVPQLRAAKIRMYAETDIEEQSSEDVVEVPFEPLTEAEMAEMADLVKDQEAIGDLSSALGAFLSDASDADVIAGAIESGLGELDALSDAESEDAILDKLGDLSELCSAGGDPFSGDALPGDAMILNAQVSGVQMRSMVKALTELDVAVAERLALLETSSNETLLNLAATVQGQAFVDKGSAEEIFATFNALYGEAPETGSVAGKAMAKLHAGATITASEKMASILEKYAEIERISANLGDGEVEEISEKATAALAKIMKVPAFHTMSIDSLNKVKERTEKAKLKLGTAYRDQTTFVDFCNELEAWIAFQGRLPSLKSALEEYNAQLQSAETQLTSLSAALIAHDDGTDEDLIDIAEDNLTILFEHHPEAVEDASTEFLGTLTANAPRNLDELRSVAQSFGEFISSSEEIAACESNPFGVTVSFVNPLFASLERINNC